MKNKPLKDISRERLVMGKNEEYAFQTNDVFGYTVRCSISNWEQHIVSKHDELENRKEDVVWTITSPDVVYGSMAHENRYIACRAYSDLAKPTMKVVVQRGKEERTAEVVTAYTAVNEGGQNIDTHNKLYP